jgi:hypothetical protein
MLGFFILSTEKGLEKGKRLLIRVPYYNISEIKAFNYF